MKSVYLLEWKDTAQLNNEFENIRPMDIFQAFNDNSEEMKLTCPKGKTNEIFIINKHDNSTISVRIDCARIVITPCNTDLIVPSGQDIWQRS